MRNILWVIEGRGSKREPWQYLQNQQRKLEALNSLRNWRNADSPYYNEFRLRKFVAKEPR
jgi:hypothetical protein